MQQNSELTIDQKLQIARMATDAMIAAISQWKSINYEQIFHTDRDDGRKYLPVNVLTETYNQLVMLITPQQSDSV